MTAALLIGAVRSGELKGVRTPDGHYSVRPADLAAWLETAQ